MDTRKALAVAMYVLLKQLRFLFHLLFQYSTVFCCHFFLFLQWRSPEEYHDDFLNEKVDVFSLGNNMYGLLTGLGVFHEIRNYDEVQYMVGKGVKAWIDQRYKERSLAEVKLAEIIEKCHEYYEEDRPSIFEVVDFLQRAVEEVHEKMNKTS